MGFYLGIDAGGTRTEAAIGDEHTILARASGGSIKVLRLSPHEAERNLRELLGELTKRAGVSLKELSSTCVGISGNTLTTVNGWVWTTLGPLISGDMDVCGDAEIALDAAFHGGPGVLVIAGTGSNTLGRAPSGELVSIGGWGPVLGDEGSGHWIGLEALRRSFRARDRGEPLRLLNAIAEFWGTDDLDRIVDRAHTVPPPHFAALSPLVFQAANRGDSLSLTILEDAGRLLAADAALALAKVRALNKDAPSAPIPIAFTGSVLAEIAPVRNAFLSKLLQIAPDSHTIPTPIDPIEGALWRARQCPGDPE